VLRIVRMCGGELGEAVEMDFVFEFRNRVLDFKETFESLRGRG
jgi:hypothetical protein